MNFMNWTDDIIQSYCFSKVCAVHTIKCRTHNNISHYTIGTALNTYCNSLSIICIIYTYTYKYIIILYIVYITELILFVSLLIFICIRIYYIRMHMHIWYMCINIHIN